MKEQAVNKNIQLREVSVKCGGSAVGEIYEACVLKAGPYPMGKVLAPWGGKLTAQGFEVTEPTGYVQWPADLRK